MLVQTKRIKIGTHAQTKRVKIGAILITFRQKGTKSVQDLLRSDKKVPNRGTDVGCWACSSSQVGIKQKTPHNNTLSRKPLKLSEFAIHLILDLRDVLI